MTRSPGPSGPESAKAVGDSPPGSLADPGGASPAGRQPGSPGRPEGLPGAGMVATTGAQVDLRGGPCPPATPIDEIALSTRARDCLRRAGIETFKQIALLREADLLRTGLWVGDVRKIVAALSRQGLALREQGPSARVWERNRAPTSGTTAAHHNEEVGAQPSERDAALLAARARGDTLRQAGARVGVSGERARQILARLGAPDAASSKSARERRASKAAEERRDQLIAAFRDGTPLREIAAAAELSQAAVNDLLKRHPTVEDRAERRVAISMRPRRPPPPRYTDGDLLEAIRQVVKTVGYVPTSGTYNEIAKANGGMPSLATINNRFGGWNAAVRAAGHIPALVQHRHYARGWTEGTCLQALRNLVDELGRLPSSSEYRQLSPSRSDLPSYSTLRARVGPWSTITPLVDPAAEHPAATAAATPAPRPPDDPPPNPGDQRTAHLVALVEGGATLEQAGAVYGIGRERVRQLLKGHGISSGRRAPRNPPARGPSDPGPTLGMAAETLWRKGMRYRELAEHLEIPQQAARELVCERVPRAERVRLIAEKLKCRFITTDEILAAIHDATEILGHQPAKPAYERLRAQGLIEGPDSATISHRLGWSKALALAGKLGSHPAPR